MDEDNVSSVDKAARFTPRYSADTIQSAILQVAVDVSERLAQESNLPLEVDLDDIPTDRSVRALLGSRHTLCPASILLDLAIAFGVPPPPLIRDALR